MAFNLTAQLNLQGPSNVKQIAAQIRKDLGTINANVQFKIDPAVARNVGALSSALKTLNQNFATTVNSANSAASAIRAFGNSVNSVKIANIPQQLNQASKAISNINKAASSSQLGKAASEMSEFGKQAGLAVRRFVAFSSVTSIIYGVTNSINNGIQAFIDYDKELVRLQQVTGETAAGLSKLQSQISNLSVTYGVSSKELTQVASTLAQAGLSARETEKALKALALSSLAPSFDSMNETVEGSIALMRQFGISAEDLESALGAVNTVAARFAVESSDIITAIQRTGSVFATASKGVSEGKDALNEFISVFTSVRATTRESAETIATGLRTIFTRIQRGSTIDALKEFGVNLTDAEGKFVGAYKAVELLSKGLSNLDPRSLDFSRIVEELGGFRQIGKVIPLIQQFSVAQEALKTAQRGQGSLAKDAATAQLSLANQIAKVREEFFALFREIGQSKGFQSLVRGALTLTSGLIKLTDSLKGILPALAVIGAFKGFRALTEFASGAATGIRRGPDNKAQGGIIRKFARGGVVPGTGSGDTVPAMLEPGEFVIRKNAVKTIGADRLHEMNKYGSGGSIRSGRTGKRQGFAKGGAVKIDKIQNIKRVRDGDSFVVDALPKPEPFTAEFRIAEWDAYETMGTSPTSRKTGESTVTKKKYEEILKLNKNNQDIINKIQPKNQKGSTYTIPPEAKVTNDLTAVGAGNKATSQLKRKFENIDFDKLTKQIVQGRKDKYDRLLIKSSTGLLDIDDELKTGRTFEYNLGGKVQKFMDGGLVEQGGNKYLESDVIKAMSEVRGVQLSREEAIKEFLRRNEDGDWYYTNWGIPGKSQKPPKWLAPYREPDALDRLQGVMMEKQDRIEDWKRRRGIRSSEYEGKTQQEQRFLRARGRRYFNGGMIQKFMAGGKAKETRSFGSGDFPFPKRISNAYFREIDEKVLKTRAEQLGLYGAFAEFPETKRIKVDDQDMSDLFERTSFDESAFKESFKRRTSTLSVFKGMSDFAKFIGLPQEDLSLVLPEHIDFSKMGGLGPRGQFDRTAMGQRGAEGYDLSQFGFGSAQEQDLYGYEKLVAEKQKEIKKILKTPVKTFEDGSFQYDEVAAKKTWDEINDLQIRIANLKSTKMKAEATVRDQIQAKAAQTGRGSVSLNTGGLTLQKNDTFYHELTHQLFQGLRTRSSETFDKYKARVVSLFEGDNNDLADAFDSLEQSYNSADVVYGRSYKIGTLDKIIQQNRSSSRGSKPAQTPEAAADATKFWAQSLGIKKARDFKPINEDVNKTLLNNSISQSYIDRIEDSGKEEFLTTLIQNANRLDPLLQGTLDSTLDELLGSAGITRQKYAEGGRVERKIGIIDTDMLRDPANAGIVGPAMEKLGLTNVSEYSRELGRLSVRARKDKSLSKLISIAGAPGSGKSSIATGRGATDDATLRKTTRSPVLTPDDIAKFNEIIVLTSTASEEKLDAYLRDVDRAYILSSSTESEQERVRLNREKRDLTGEGLYGRPPGTTTTASRDFTLEESILRDELGSKAMVLGRRGQGFGLRRKRESELPEIVQAGGFYTGGFSPPTRGHRGAFDTLLGSMIARNPNASAEDIILSIAPNLPMDRGEGKTEQEKLEHAARYGIFPADFRKLLAQINFPTSMISTQETPQGNVLPPMMEVEGVDGRRRFAKLKGALAITSGKKEGALDKYGRAGMKVTDIPRIDDISATEVRKALFAGDDATLMKFLNPEVASILMGNRAQLRNRSVMVPMLIEEIKKYGAVQKEQTNSEIQKILADAPGGPYSRITKKARENAPDVVAQVERMRKERDQKAEGLLGYRAHNIVSLLSAKYPDAYGLDISRRAQVSAKPADLAKETISAQIAEAMSGEFGTMPTSLPSSIQQAILEKVTKETAAPKGSGELPTTTKEILAKLGDRVLPSDPRFGEFSGKRIRDTATASGRLGWWATKYADTLSSKPEKLAAYEATRDYVKDLYSGAATETTAQALATRTTDVSKSTLLAMVGLYGKNAINGPLTWNLGKNAQGEDVSMSATIMERVLPEQYKSVADYISSQTDITVANAAKMLGKKDPKKLSEKQKGVLNQGNIEGGILEQLLAVLGGDVLDDAVRTRAIDFPSGIGEFAANIFDIPANIPTEAKRTINSDSRTDAIEEFQRHFRAIYGIPEPQKFAKGGKVTDEYKQILASILPPSMLTDDGMLKMPSGQAEPIEFVTPKKLGLFSKIFGAKKQDGKPYYMGGLAFKGLRYRLEKDKDILPEDEYKALKTFIDQNLLFEGNDDVISTVNPKHKGVLPHETFHDIQGYLYDNYPEIMDKLFASIDSQKENIAKWYNDPRNKDWSGPGNYTLDDFFPTSQAKGFSYPTDLISSAMQGVQKITKKQVTDPTITTISRGYRQQGINETIPVLLSAASVGNEGATQILSKIFGDAGLNPNFYKTLPKYAEGGSVEDSVSNIGPDKPAAKPEKKYPAIALRSENDTINVGYLKNDNMQGHIIAYKNKDYLYTIASAKATGGGGPRLYDVVMEAAAEQGAMLASDRVSVSNDAKKVWEYYFKNRGDVQKKPLEPEDWTKNNDLIDPKLYGKRETWPPPNDPAWILQSGYTKKPSLINDPTKVKRSDANGLFRLGDAGLVRLFAKGGTAEDTVPALLTPGEFVINKKAAQKIGYSQLERLNKADKIKGYNKGGIVGGSIIQKFASGGLVDTLMRLLSESSSGSIDLPRLSARPDKISSSTIAASSDLASSAKLFIDTLDEAGYSMISMSKILDQMARGADVSYSSIEKAMTKDLERLKISGASIDAIVAAEKQLKIIRDKSSQDVTKRQFIESGFRETKIGTELGSGATQQKVLIEAQKKEELIRRQRRSQIEKDLIKRDPSLLGDREKLAQKTQKRLEKIEPSIREQAFGSATEKTTGIKRSELKALGISGQDIQNYVSQSMRDRKTLAQMDKQLIASKLEELQNTSKFKSASAAEQQKMLQEAKSAAKEEVSKRREIINEIAADRGESGVGAANFMDYKNSPIYRSVRNRYYDRDANRIKYETILGDGAMASGLVAGQSKNIAELMYNTSSDQGKIDAARTSVQIERAATTASTGLAVASQLAMIPGYGPFLAGVAAVGTGLFAAADAVYDFSGAQAKAAAEVEKSILVDRLNVQSEQLKRAFDKLVRNTNDAAARMQYSMKLERALDTTDRLANQQIQTRMTVGSQRTWGQWYMQGGLLGQAPPELENTMNAPNRDEWNKMMLEAAQLYSDVASQGYQALEMAARRGTSADMRDPNTQAGADFLKQARAIILSDVEKQSLYQTAMQAGGREYAEETVLKPELLKIFDDAMVKAAEEAGRLARAMELADKAGRKLAQSFEKMFNSINQSINVAAYRSEQRSQSLARRRSAMTGEAELGNISLSGINTLENPNVDPYQTMSTVDSVARQMGLSEKDRLRFSGAAQLQLQLGDTIRSNIAQELSGKKSTDVDDARKTAERIINEQVDALNLPEELKASLRTQLISPLEEVTKKSKEGNTGSAAVEDFLAGVDNLIKGAQEAGKAVLETAKQFLQFQQDRVLKQFAEDIQAASKAAKEASNYFKAARDITYKGNMNLRQVLTGVGETYEETRTRVLDNTAELTGGQFDPNTGKVVGGERTVQGIMGRLDGLNEQRDRAEQEAKAFAESGDMDKAAQRLRESEQLNSQIRDTREALDNLANSTELVEKAFEDLKNVRELQKTRESFVNTLLTNTPEEADKLNQTFIRLQRNLSGGLNAAENQRDARKAFNQTLRETGSVREAIKAGNTVLANQRKETLALSQDAGFRAAQELNIRNQYAEGKGKPGMNADEAVAEYFKTQQLQLTKQMAIESGMINNPLVQQSLAAIEDPKADASMRQAAERYLEAVGLRASATEAQGQLALMESQQALADANNSLRISIDDLRATMEAVLSRNAGIESGEIVPGFGGDRRVRLPVAVGAPPVPRSNGGIIYAQEGQLINFEPKGTDTVPAMLTPGEFVVNARSTAKHLPILKAINSGYYSTGGTVEEFNSLDRNRDNQLVMPELNDNSLFGVLDRDKSGYIDLLEYTGSMPSSDYARGIPSDRYNRQQAYLNRFRPEIRSRKEAELLSRAALLLPDGSSVRGKMFSIEGTRSTESSLRPKFIEVFEKMLRNQGIDPASVVQPAGSAALELPTAFDRESQARPYTYKDRLMDDFRSSKLYRQGRLRDYPGLRYGNSPISPLKSPFFDVTLDENGLFVLGAIKSFDSLSVLQKAEAIRDKQVAMFKSQSLDAIRRNETKPNGAVVMRYTDVSTKAERDYRDEVLNAFAKESDKSYDSLSDMEKIRIFDSNVRRTREGLGLPETYSEAVKLDQERASALKQKLDEGLVLTRREYSDLIDLGKPLYGSPLAARYEQLNNVQQMKSALGLDSQESKDKKPRLLDPLFGVDDTTIQTYNESIQTARQQQKRAELEGRFKPDTTEELKLVGRRAQSEAGKYRIETGQDTVTKQDRPTRLFVGASDADKAVQTSTSLPEFISSTQTAMDRRVEEYERRNKTRKEEGKKVIDFYQQRLDEAMADNDGDGWPDSSEKIIEERKKDLMSAKVTFGIMRLNPIGRQPESYYDTTGIGPRWASNEYKDAEDFLAAQGLREERARLARKREIEMERAGQASVAALKGFFGLQGDSGVYYLKSPEVAKKEDQERFIAGARAVLKHREERIRKLQSTQNRSEAEEAELQELTSKTPGNTSLSDALIRFEEERKNAPLEDNDINPIPTPGLGLVKQMAEENGGLYKKMGDMYIFNNGNSLLIPDEPESTGAVGVAAASMLTPVGVVTSVASAARVPEIIDRVRKGEATTQDAIDLINITSGLISIANSARTAEQLSGEGRGILGGRPTERQVRVEQARQQAAQQQDLDRQLEQNILNAEYAARERANDLAEAQLWETIGKTAKEEVAAIGKELVAQPGGSARRQFGFGGYDPNRDYSIAPEPPTTLSPSAPGGFFSLRNSTILKWLGVKDRTTGQTAPTSTEVLDPLVENAKRLTSPNPTPIPDTVAQQIQASAGFIADEALQNAARTGRPAMSASRILTSAEEAVIAERLQKLVIDTPVKYDPSLRGTGVSGRFIHPKPGQIQGKILVADMSDDFVLEHEGAHAASRAMGILEQEGLLTQGILDRLPEEYKVLSQNAGNRTAATDAYLLAREANLNTGAAISKDVLIDRLLARVEEEALVANATGTTAAENPSYVRRLQEYNDLLGQPADTPPPLKVKYKANGGMIYASDGQLINFEPKGTDTVPAMLTPGEFVVNARSTAQHLPLLQAINSNNYLSTGGSPSKTKTPHKGQGIVPQLPTLETPEATQSALESWMRHNYARKGMFDNNPMGYVRPKFYSQISDHLRQSPSEGGGDNFTRYTAILDEKFKASIKDLRVPYEINEDPTADLDDSNVMTPLKDLSLPRKLFLPNNPDSQYFGQNLYAKDAKDDPTISPDAFTWGPALPRSLVGLHEREHMTQDPVSDEQIAKIGGTVYQQLFKNNSSAMFAEPGAVAGEIINSLDAARKATGALVPGNIEMAPGYNPSLEFLYQQAKKYGYEGAGGDKNMTQLLNTAEGQAWLKMQMESFSKAGNPSEYDPPIRTNLDIPTPSSESELRSIAEKSYPTPITNPDPMINTREFWQYAARGKRPWTADPHLELFGLSQGSNYDFGPMRGISNDNYFDSVINGTYERKKWYKSGNLVGEGLPTQDADYYDNTDQSLYDRYNAIDKEMRYKATGGIIYASKGGKVKYLVTGGLLDISNPDPTKKPDGPIYDTSNPDPTKTYDQSSIMPAVGMFSPDQLAAGNAIMNAGIDKAALDYMSGQTTTTDISGLNQRAETSFNDDGSAAADLMRSTTSAAADAREKIMDYENAVMEHDNRTMERLHWVGETAPMQLLGGFGMAGAGGVMIIGGVGAGLYAEAQSASLGPEFTEGLRSSSNDMINYGANLTLQGGALFAKGVRVPGTDYGLDRLTGGAYSEQAEKAAAEIQKIEDKNALLSEQLFPGGGATYRGANIATQVAVGALADPLPYIGEGLGSLAPGAKYAIRHTVGDVAGKFGDISGSVADAGLAARTAASDAAIAKATASGMSAADAAAAGTAAFGKPGFTETLARSAQSAGKNTRAYLQGMTEADQVAYVERLGGIVRATEEATGSNAVVTSIRPGPGNSKWYIGEGAGNTDMLGGGGISPRSLSGGFPGEAPFTTLTDDLSAANRAGKITGLDYNRPITLEGGAQGFPGNIGKGLYVADDAGGGVDAAAASLRYTPSNLASAGSSNAGVIVAETAPGSLVPRLSTTAGDIAQESAANRALAERWFPNDFKATQDVAMGRMSSSEVWNRSVEEASKRSGLIAQEAERAVMESLDASAIGRRAPTSQIIGPQSPVTVALPGGRTASETLSTSIALVRPDAITRGTFYSVRQLAAPSSSSITTSAHLGEHLGHLAGRANMFYETQHLTMGEFGPGHGGHGGHGSHDDHGGHGSGHGGNSTLGSLDQDALKKPSFHANGGLIKAVGLQFGGDPLDPQRLRWRGGWRRGLFERTSLEESSLGTGINPILSLRDTIYNPSQQGDLLGISGGNGTPSEQTVSYNPDNDKSSIINRGPYIYNPDNDKPSTNRGPYIYDSRTDSSVVPYANGGLIKAVGLQFGGKAPQQLSYGAAFLEDLPGLSQNLRSQLSLTDNLPMGFETRSPSPRSSMDIGPAKGYNKLPTTDPISGIDYNALPGPNTVGGYVPIPNSENPLELKYRYDPNQTKQQRLERQLRSIGEIVPGPGQQQVGQDGKFYTRDGFGGLNTYVFDSNGNLVQLGVATTDPSMSEADKIKAREKAIVPLSTGGLIYASNGALASAQSGTDTVPAMLTPGEFVVNREASQRHMPLLQAINSGYFTRGGIVNYLANGGIVSPKYYSQGALTEATNINGVSSVGGVDVSAMMSAIESIQSAVNQLGENGANMANQIGSALQQNLGSFQENFNMAVNTFRSSTQEFGESASSIPSMLEANINQTTSLNHIGLDSLKGNMEQQIYSNSTAISNNVSQRTMFNYDKSAFDGAMNSAINNRPMRG